MNTIRIFTNIVVVALTLASSALAQSSLTNGLAAYYPLNGNANDASGNGMNGTAVNGLSYVLDRDRSAFVANFTGSSQYISLPGSISNYEDVSVTFWLKTGQSNPNTFPYSQFVVSRDIAGAAYDWNICFGQGRKMQFHTGTPTNDNLVLTEPNDLTSNQWVLVSCVADSSNGVKTIYLNAIPVAATAWVPDPFANNGLSIYLGAATGGTTLHPYLVGEMSDVRIYNRPLSATEVQQIYTVESVPCFRPASAVASVVNGFVVGTTLTDNGCGYTNVPQVVFLDGGGTGASGVAVVSSGIVQQINITDAGSGYTNPPSVFIGFPPSIAAEPQSLTVNYRQNATFNVGLGGPTPVLYQWSFNCSNLAGATGSSLTISNVTPSVLGSYSVYLTNIFGITNSAPAMLSMYPYLSAVFDGEVVDWGQEAVLQVQALGSGPITYQWYQNGRALADATNAVLDYSNIQFTNAGLYSVVVSNPYGSVTNAPAQVVVNPAGVSLGLYPGVTITGTVGYNYTVQRTGNLEDTNSWSNAANITLTQPVQLWVDTNLDASLPVNPHHFYRVLPGP
jgi:hypothetical protein